MKFVPKMSPRTLNSFLFCYSKKEKTLAAQGLSAMTCSGIEPLTPTLSR